MTAYQHGRDNDPREVVRFRSFADMQPWAAEWNELSRSVPFRRWEWLETWWRHYGPAAAAMRRRELYVLAVIDRGQSLVAVAPWFLDHSPTRGRVVRFLGEGEVCSEYLTVLVRRGEEAEVAGLLADWLARQGAREDTNRWDALSLSGVESEDSTIDQLFEELAQRDHLVHRQSGPSCWRLRLPATWEKYLAMLSKCHRKQLRRLDRDYFRSGRAVVHWVHRAEEMNDTLATLVDLHQRRWRKRGKPGCFASQRFYEFHRELAGRLLPQGGLLMNRLEFDGRPIAAEYHLAGPETVYAYQSGIDPDSLVHQPGRLSNLAAIRRGIERGDESFDFLRGDEPYKAHWRALPRPTYEAIAVPARLSARFRFGVSSAGSNLTQWMKSGWRFAESLVNG